MFLTDDYTRPHPESSVLLTIDTQTDFTSADGAATIEGTAEVVPAIAEVAYAYRRARRPVVHVVRLYREDGSNVDACRRTSVEAGALVVAPSSPGSQVVPDLLGCPVDLDHERLLAGDLQAVGDDEYILYKPRWGAFYQTRLEDHLRRWGVDTVVLAGCNFPNCPRTTLYEASERDLRVVLIADAVSGLYDRGIQELRRIGVHITTAREWSASVDHLSSASSDGKDRT